MSEFAESSGEPWLASVVRRAGFGSALRGVNQAAPATTAAVAANTRPVRMRWARAWADQTVLMAGGDARRA